MNETKLTELVKVAAEKINREFAEYIKMGFGHPGTAQIISTTFQPMSQELEGLKEALVIANRSADDQMFQKREAEARLATVEAALSQAKAALDHCRWRPHEHNPPDTWQGPIRCEVIERAIDAIDAAQARRSRGE